MKSSIISVAVLFHVTSADVYMQTPPGSNNRLDEQNRERDNANRMFDSQNNNRGGYNVGKMEYYQGEQVPLAWTNQHGAGAYQMEHSEFIIQYMCEPLVRDGTTTRTIPIKATECYDFDCDTDVRFGRHESIEYYENCIKTEANGGLFTANQNLGNQPSQKNTRQNPNGQRSGLECPSERDYYPYWNPTPWIDAVIVTANTDKCAAYVAESQNTASRWACRMPEEFFEADGTLPNNFRYSLDETVCAGQTLTDGNGTDHNAVWTEFPAHNVMYPGLEGPACIQAEQTRANHLGNPGGRALYETMWTVPDTIPDDSQCVLRLRYNITTAEYNAFDTDAGIGAGAAAAESSQQNNPNPNNDPAEVAIWESYGLTRDDVEGSFQNNNDDASREYVLENNPQADAFGALLQFNGDEAIKLQLAINTAQFGRTFQDRSHYFFVVARPDDIAADAVIKLTTVRGKRGNIVQTFPATEYFFHPAESYNRVGDYAHFAWTGSNTNPNNNDGQGKQGTDRSNMVCSRDITYDNTLYNNFEWDMLFPDGEIDEGSAGASYPSFVKTPEGYEIPDIYAGQLKEECMGGMSEEILTALATTRRYPHDQGNMEELDDAGTSFNMPPQRVTKKGCSNYMGTRNNNFSNRAQKGKFCVTEGDVGNLAVGGAGGEWCSTDGLDCVMIWPNSVIGFDKVLITVDQEDSTSVMSISNTQLTEDATITVQLGYQQQSLMSYQLMHQEACESNSEDCDLPWTSVDADVSVEMRTGGSVAWADVHALGTYKMVASPNKGPILALCVAVLGFTCCLGWVIMNKCHDRLPECCQSRIPDRLKVNNTVQMQATKVTTGPAEPQWGESA